MFDFNSELIQKIETMVRVGSLGIFGAVAKYLYDVTNGNKSFTWFSFFSFCLIAAFASNVTNEFLPKDTEYRDGIVMMVGYSCLQVLGVLETRVIQHLQGNKEIKS